MGVLSAVVAERLPDPFRLPEALLLLTVLAGLLGLMARSNLLLKALAMDVMGTGVVALFVLVAARSGLRTPILASPVLPDAAAGWADPIPQAVILTAIVIGFGLSVFTLVLARSAFMRNGSDDVRELEREDTEP